MKPSKGCDLVLKANQTEKETILNLIKRLETPLNFYEDPVYTPDERATIKEYEKLALNFYSDLKADKFISFNDAFELSKEKRQERDRSLRFFKIPMDISNKLVNVKVFEAEQEWFILLPLYCWYSEMIKNLCLDAAKKIFKSMNRRDFRGFMALGSFLGIINVYRNGRHKPLFSEINVDLRNSFDHANIDFNNEITYQDNKQNEKKVGLSEMLSMFKRIAPLYATLFACESKMFVEEIKSIAKKMGLFQS